MKLLEDNIGGKLHDIGIGNYFLNMTPETKTTKTKIDKWDYLKIKNFCIATGIINRVKGVL